jgi:hypothetical protein
MKVDPAGISGSPSFRQGSADFEDRGMVKELKASRTVILSIDSALNDLSKLRVIPVYLFPSIFETDHL